MVFKQKKITVLYAEGAASFGGSSVVMGYLVNGLDQSKFRAIVVSEMDNPFLRRLINDSAKLYVRPRQYNYVAWGKTVDRIDKLPGVYIRKFFIYLFSLLRSCANLVYLFRVLLILFKERVDVVHINNGMTDVETIIAAKIMRCKIVVHLQQVKQPGMVQKVLIKKIPEFLAISKYIKNRMVRNYVPEEKIKVVYNPVKSREVDKEAKESICRKYDLQNSKVFGIVGRVVKWKGVEEFVHAAKLVLDAVPEAKALVVGDTADGSDDFKEKLLSIVKQYGLEDRIIFTGYVEGVENIYSVLDVFVHASTTPEPFGLVITEAMSYGVAVIAADSGAPQEIITEGVTGYLVDPADKKLLAKKLIDLLTNQALRAEISENGKQCVQRNYQVDNYVGEVEGIYQALLMR